MEEVPAANSDKSASGDDQSSPSAAVTNTDNNSPSTARFAPPSKVKTEPAETVAFYEDAAEKCSLPSRSVAEASMNQPQVQNESPSSESVDNCGSEPRSIAVDQASSATPLNLSVKKRRTDGAQATPKDRYPMQQRSAFETVGRNGPIVGTPASSALSMALSSTPSPYMLNRLLPFSFLSTPGPAGPNDIDVRSPTDHRPPSGQDLLLGTYFGVSPTGKHQRPFKAYNPMDPMSALQISGLSLPLRHGNGPGMVAKGAATASSNGKTLSTAQYLTDQLLQPYRQYLQQMQQASSSPNPLSPVSTCSSTGPRGQSVFPEKGDDHTCSNNTNNNHNNSNGSNNADSNHNACRAVSLPSSTPTSASCKQQCHSPKQTNGAGPVTPSPPEVTSTSHPHTDSHHNHSHNCRQLLLAGRCLTSSSPSGSDTGASSGGMNSSTSPVTSEEPIDRPRESNGQEARNGPNLSNGSAGTVVSQEAGRRKGRVLPETLKDEAYWERRRKNNEAAKRSRDARRAKEDEIAVRAALLEQENMRLRIEVAALKAETEKLRQMLLKG
uniref:BZIP domain-containing protein n=1 Tax=Trichuris muris TaxID=70415 RepID=A0A5S6QYV4_TRIMR